jgi:hypothetical protein
MFWVGILGGRGWGSLGGCGDLVEGVLMAMKRDRDQMCVPREIVRVAEGLVDCREGRERDSVLLRGLQATGWVGAAAIWRRDPRDGRWWQVLARGVEGVLPSADQVEAVAAGLLGPEIPPMKRVLLGGVGAERVALGLGQVFCDEQQEAWIEGLFETWSCLEPIGQAARGAGEGSLLEGLAGLLPQSGDDLAGLGEALGDILAEDVTGDEIQGFGDETDEG